MVGGLSGLAVITLLVILLRRMGPLRDVVTPEHLHDLGSLMLGFSVFWAYIWFCQYMLIWYANIPEEATWFQHRLQGGWTTLFWLNPILNWIVPFVALMTLKAKKDPSILGQVALVVGILLPTLAWCAPCPSRRSA